MCFNTYRLGAKSALQRAFHRYLFFAMHTRLHSTERFLVFETLLFVVVATALTALIQPVFSPTLFAFFHAFVALAAWRGGWRSGVLATILSVLSADFFFFEPRYSFAIKEEFASFIVFAAVSLFISYVVTLQKNTSRTLDFQRARTEHVLENINDMFMAIDRNWCITYLNQRARDYHPDTMDGALGLNFWDVFIRHKATETEERFHRVMKTRAPDQWETIGRYSENFFKISVFPTNDGGLSVFVSNISEQKLAEIAEQDAKERLDIALSAGEIGTWQWNVARDHLELSSRAFAFFGVPADDEFSFAKMQTHLHPDDVEKIKTQVATAVRDKGEHDFEYRVIHPDSSLHMLMARGRAVVNDNGETTHLVGVVQDMTERKTATELLAQSTRKLKLALDAAKAGTWEWDVKGDKTVWSDELYRVFGISREEYPASQKVWGELIHPEDQEIVKTGFERAIAERGDFDLEHRILHRGVVRWINSRGRGFFDEKGELSRTAGIIVNVTERKEREAERRVLEQRFQTMADSAPVLIWMIDAHKKRVWLNKPWLEWTGRTLEQELGDDWAQGIYHEDIAHYAEVIERSWENHEPFSNEFRHRHHSGEYRWLLTRGRPLFKSSGEFEGFIGSCVDIEEMKQAEAERDQLLANERTARSEAEHVSRMKDEFLATLSHELRTPLNAILGWANLLRSGALEGAEAEQGLEVIERNARLQAQLIEDLLDMSRVISGKMRLDVQRVELASIIDAAIESIQPASNAKELRFQRVLDPDAGLVMGDPNRLQQIVWNLLSNAVKFTPKSGRIQVVLKRVDSHVEIVVSDSGVGITPYFLPHVFDRFRQADSSSTRQYGGLGLGLGIVRNLVELHGGTVQAISEGEEKGATFVVSLPLAPVSDDMPNSAHTRHTFQEEPCPSALARLRVLVVDDEPDARFLVQRILEGCGAVVSTAGSAEQAMQTLRTQSFDVLISDIGMPMEDGYSLIKRVRALPETKNRDIRAVALTALARDEDRRRALLSGFQMHLPKPVDPPELIAVVANVAGLVAGEMQTKNDGFENDETENNEPGTSATGEL